MIASTTRMAAALLVAVPAAFAVPAIARDHDPDASGAKIVRLGPAVETGVRTVRGSRIRHPYDGAATAVRPGKAAPAAGPAAEAVAGETLWLIDRKADRLTGCTLAPSARAANVQVIRCSARRLP